MGVILSILAVWRLTHLFIWEDGPFEMFARIRNWAGVEYNEYSEPYGNDALSTLFSCVYCLSVWLSSLFVLLDYATNPKRRAMGLFYSIYTPLAISAGVIAVNKLIRSQR